MLPHAIDAELPLIIYRSYTMDKSMEDAIRYISGELKADPKANKSKLIGEAAQKFDLDPRQTEFLVNKFILNS
jgi:hypothetical protein